MTGIPSGLERRHASEALWTAEEVAAFIKCSVSYVYKSAEDLWSGRNPAALVETRIVPSRRLTSRRSYDHDTTKGERVGRERFQRRAQVLLTCNH